MALLEVLIGLSLISLLLTFFFSFFVESAKLDKRLTQMRTEALEREHLQMRLQGIFSGIDPSGRECGFYTMCDPKNGKKVLAVRFDQGVDPDPLFSGVVQGRIFMDDMRRLLLQYWPLDQDPDQEKQTPLRTEILSVSLAEWGWEFLAEVGFGGNPGKKITASLEWRSDWPKNSFKIPSMIRLRLKKPKQRELGFAFLIPSSEPRVTYWEGSGFL